MRTAVVVNPSKVVDLDGRRAEICAALATAGWPEPLWLPTTPEDPGRGQTRQAVRDGVEVVFACGGDGTVMACATELAGTTVALAVLPSGTGNLLAANLGLPNDVAPAVAVATSGHRRRIDVGACDEHCFTVMAGMGFDAAMLDASSDRLKSRLGWPAYILGGLRRLRDRPMRVRVRLDGLPPLRRRARTVLVANVGRLQAGIQLLPAAQPDDGVFEVAILNPRHLRDWLALTVAVLRRRPSVPRMETFHATRVEVLSNRPQPREVDGDVITPGRLLRVVLRPAALTVCVPAPAVTGSGPAVRDSAPEAPCRRSLRNGGWRCAVSRRSIVPRLATAFAAGLIGVLALAPLESSAAADPGPGITDTPPPSPTDTGQASPTPVDSPTPAPGSPTPTPDSPSPPPEQPPPTTAAVAPPAGPAHVLAVMVVADNAVLGPDYWAGNSDGTFVITVKNTGTVVAHTNLHYTVPAGVTDTATGPCQNGTCTVDALRPGASRSLTIAIAVSPDAWRSAPLTGTVDFSATAPGSAAARGTVTWGVIFPPGPPAAGINLQVADVILGTDITTPGQLVIRLTNTGVRPAAGVIDLVVPAGVNVTQLPGECQQQQQIDPTTSECGVGTVAPEAQQTITIPLNVSDDVRADSPLAGLVRATLTPSGQNARSTQASYQIIAPHIQSGVSAASTASPVQPPTPRGAAKNRTTDAAPLIIFGSLPLGLVAFVVVMMRRVGKPRRGSLTPSPRTDTGQPAGAEPTAPAEEVKADTPDESVPAGFGAINLEWTELPDSTPPPGQPID